MESDPWLRDHAKCIRLADDVMHGVQQRNQLQRQGGDYTRVYASTRESIQELSAQVKMLRTKLIQLTSTNVLGVGETDRREGMLDSLVARERELNNAFRNFPTSSSAPSESVWGAPRGAGGLNPWLDEDSISEQMSGMSHDKIFEHQERTIRDQDEGLDALAKVLSRTKMIARDMGNEVDSQTVLIDDITYQGERANTKLLRTTKQTEAVERKSRSCCMIVVIVLLLIAIVVVAVIPT